MKRILFIGAGKEFPQGAFRFLQSIFEDGEIGIMGLFFRAIDDEFLHVISLGPIAAPELKLRERELEDLRAIKAMFARKCGEANLKYQVHPNEDGWDSQLFARESRFSDLVVLSAEQFYAEVDPSQPNLFLREALHAAECPVMVVPENYREPQRLIIAYDGSRNSVHAIKQLAYLFPSYTDLPTEFIYVKEDNSAEMPDKELLEDFTRFHFDSMNFSHLPFKAADYFADWINEKKNVLLVSGSFGRSPFSNIARESFSRQVVHEHKMPVFVAHI